MPRGGRRPGAGRPRKGEERRQPQTENEAIEALAPTGTTDAKEFLERVVSGVYMPTAAQLDAAKSLLPYQHRKLGEAGKKEQRQEEAGKVASRFAPAAPPKLVALAGKKI